MILKKKFDEHSFNTGWPSVQYNIHVNINKGLRNTLSHESKSATSSNLYNSKGTLIVRYEKLKQALTEWRNN